MIKLSLFGRWSVLHPSTEFRRGFLLSSTFSAMAGHLQRFNLSFRIINLIFYYARASDGNTKIRIRAERALVTRQPISFAVAVVFVLRQKCTLPGTTHEINLTVVWVGEREFRAHQCISLPSLISLHSSLSNYPFLFLLKRNANDTCMLFCFHFISSFWGQIKIFIHSFNVTITALRLVHEKMSLKYTMPLINCFALWSHFGIRTINDKCSAAKNTTFLRREKKMCLIFGFVFGFEYVTRHSAVPTIGCSG